MAEATKGLKKLREAGGDKVRAEHGNWGNPNRKEAKHLKKRTADFDAHLASAGQGYHRPGSNKK